jgi:hypothetical protein
MAVPQPIATRGMYGEDFLPALASAVGVKAVVSKSDGLDKLKLVDNVTSFATAQSSLAGLI